MQYHLPGSTVFWAEGLPLDASPAEFAELLRHLEDGLQLPIGHARTLQHIHKNVLQGTPTTRLPFGLFGTCIFMGSDAAHYTYGFHHGQRSRLALRIIPISYVRAYAATGSKQTDTITSYVSIHPIPDMGPHTAEIVEVQGSDPLAITRVMSQIPNNRSGKMNIIIPYV